MGEGIALTYFQARATTQGGKRTGMSLLFISGRLLVLLVVFGRVIGIILDNDISKINCLIAECRSIKTHPEIQCAIWNDQLGRVNNYCACVVENHHVTPSCANVL